MSLAIQRIEILYRAREQNITKLRTLVDVGAVSEQEFDTYCSETKELLLFHQINLLNGDSHNQFWNADEIMSIAHIKLKSLSTTANSHFRKYLVYDEGKSSSSPSTPRRRRYFTLSRGFLEETILAHFWRFLDIKDKGRLRIAAYNLPSFRSFVASTKLLCSKAFDSVIDDDFTTFCSVLIAIDPNSTAFDADLGHPDIGLGNGFSLLMYAVEHCRVAMVSELLQRGVDVNAKDDRGASLFDHLKHAYFLYSYKGLCWDEGKTIGLLDIISLLKHSNYRLGPHERWESFNSNNIRK